MHTDAIEIRTNSTGKIAICSELIPAETKLGISVRNILQNNIPKVPTPTLGASHFRGLNMEENFIFFFTFFTVTRQIYAIEEKS